MEPYSAGGERPRDQIGDERAHMAIAAGQDRAVAAAQDICVDVIPGGEPGGWMRSVLARLLPAVTRCRTGPQCMNMIS